MPYDIIRSEVNRKIRSKAMAQDAYQEACATLLEAKAQGKALSDAEVAQMARAVCNRLKRAERSEKQRLVSYELDPQKAYREMGGEEFISTEYFTTDRIVPAETDERPSRGVDRRIDNFWKARRRERNRLLASGVSQVQAERRAHGYAVQHSRDGVAPTAPESLSPWLEVLTERQREVVTRHFWLGHSATQIANDTGVSQSSVSQTLERAKAKLKKNLA